MKTVIMAGGKGTRIAQLVGDVPKPMIPILGKPVLEYEIENLASQGLTDIILTVHHMHEQIVAYFGDGSGISPATGKPFGVHIAYFVEDRPYGNAGALLELLDAGSLHDDFLLLNGDAMFDIDFARFLEFHQTHNAQVTLMAHPNSHPFDSGLLVVDSNNQVVKWMAKEDDRSGWYANLVNAGIHVVAPQAIENARQPGKTTYDLDRDILKPLCRQNKLYAYKSPEYLKDMGTPERYYSVIRDVEAGIPAKHSLRNAQKAVFLDRDGTINRYAGFVRAPEQLELLPHAAEGIRAINEAGYLAIVVTNQPVIARGEVTEPGLREIHNKMETLLGEQGAYVNDIYYCPHHPDKGFEGEIPELKIECDCRKPKPGMLLQAARDYNIDLKESWMVGDSENDILAGKAAGCKTALIANTAADAPEAGQLASVRDLLAFAGML